MKFIKYITFTLLLLSLFSCHDLLDKSPKDKITGEDLYNNPEGTRTYMANLYHQLPVEDFTWFKEGFNFNDVDPNNGGFASAMHTDEAIHSEFQESLGDGDYTWFEEGYNLIRDVNIVRDAIPTLDISEERRRNLEGESDFILAYAYFALAKRYGGVPLIDTAQEFTADVEELRKPRSQEKETWDFVIELLDNAIENLPESWTGGDRRATVWAAHALKSRVALHAASIAKYGDEAPLSGTAVDHELVGIEREAAEEYYQAVIEASEAIMNSNEFSLFRPEPDSPEEAAENYRLLFEDPNNALEEAIFIKGYARPGNNMAHNYDIWYNPRQTADGWPHPGRMNPTLDLVDLYESYDNPGESAPVVTTQDGDIDDYGGFDPSKDYLRYDTPHEIFEDKDARLWGTVILPDTEWRDTEIKIQAGYVEPDGEATMLTRDEIEVNGQTYHTYGASDRSQYSGFDTHGGNYTRTGFSFKKFLDTDGLSEMGWNRSTTDFIDIRYAEVLLNYAEAVIESGQGDENMAEEALNDLRRRAGHTQNIPLTLENVMRERRIELAFENKRYWDLMRRREFHTEFNNRNELALLPLLDLRVDPPQYIFVRVETPNSISKTFENYEYYRFIPGIGANKLTQNPQY